MKKINIIYLLVLLFLFSSSISFGAVSTIEDVFPKASELSGGASAWIVGGLTKETRGRCQMYENTYTYYSTMGEKIFDIERKNTYMVSVRLYSCNNFISAMDKYDELVKVENKFKDKKMHSPAPFGERGTLFAMPSKDKTSMMADFYLTFILRSFVVQVYSDDGFAQMDMAGFIEKRLVGLVKKSGENYFINKINLLSEFGGKEYPSAVTFTGDNITSVSLEGIVFDSANKALPNVKITAKETGESVYSDSSGKFNIDINFGSGKSVKFTKMIFLPINDSDNKSLKTGVYKITTDKKSKLKNNILSVTAFDDKIIGKLYSPDGTSLFPVTGSQNEGELKFAADCAPSGAAIKCSIFFKGTQKDGMVKGTFSGAGGGSWQIEPNSLIPINDKPYLVDSGLTLKQIVSGSDEASSKNQNEFIINNAKKRLYIKLDFKKKKFEKDLIFFKSAKLDFNIISADIKSNAKLILYEIGEKEQLKKLSVIADISPKKIPKTVSIDISPLVRNISDKGYLIGVESKSGASVNISEAKEPIELTYYRDVNNYTQKEIVTGYLKTFEGEDIASNSNALKGDGTPDIEFELTIAAKGRTLEFLEITAEGENTRRWNTNIFDIYPLTIIKNTDIIINKSNGTISYKLNNDEEILTVNVFKGTLLKENVKSFKVKIVLDGRVYENELKMSK